jgi:hypothetical protein
VEGGACLESGRRAGVPPSCNLTLTQKWIAVTSPGFHRLPLFFLDNFYLVPSTQATEVTALPYLTAPRNGLPAEREVL